MNINNKLLYFIIYVAIILFYFIMYIIKPDRYIKNLTFNCDKNKDIITNTFIDFDTFSIINHMIIPYSLIFIIVIYLTDKLNNIHKLILPFICADIIVNIIKIFRYAERPDINERLNYLCKETITSELSGHNLYIYLEGYRSSPSAHSSIAFSFVAFVGYMYYTNYRNKNNLILLLTFIFTLIYSLLCCESRIIDKKHHINDVLLGIFNGFFITLILLIIKNPLNI